MARDLRYIQIRLLCGFKQLGVFPISGDRLLDISCLVMSVIRYGISWVGTVGTVGIVAPERISWSCIVVKSPRQITFKLWLYKLVANVFWLELTLFLISSLYPHVFVRIEGIEGIISNLHNSPVLSIAKASMTPRLVHTLFTPWFTWPQLLVAANQPKPFIPNAWIFEDIMDRKSRETCPWNCTKLSSAVGEHLQALSRAEVVLLSLILHVIRDCKDQVSNKLLLQLQIHKERKLSSTPGKTWHEEIGDSPNSHHARWTS